MEILPDHQLSEQELTSIISQAVQQFVGLPATPQLRQDARIQTLFALEGFLIGPTSKYTEVANYTFHYHSLWSKPDQMIRWTDDHWTMKNVGESEKHFNIQIGYAQ